MKAIAHNIERFAITRFVKNSSFPLAGVLRFLGRDAFSLLVLNGFGSIFLALSEIAMAAFIQLFLVALGLIPPSLNSLFGGMQVEVWQACVFLALVGVVRSAGQYLTNLSSGFAQNVLQDRLRTILLAQVIHSNSPPSSSRVLNLTSEIFPKAASFAYSTAQFLAIGSQMLVLFAVMMFVAWKEASAALLGFFLLGLWVTKIGEKVRANAASLPTQHENVVRTINRVNSNWLLVFLLGTQIEEFNRSVADVRAYTTQAKRTHKLGVLNSSFPPFVGILILIGVILLSQGAFQTPGSKLLVFLYLFIRFVQNMAGGLGNLGHCQGVYPHFKESYQFFLSAESKLRSALSGMSKSNVGSASKYELPRNPVAVDVQNICYRYSAGSPLIFNQFSLTLMAGEQVAVVGRSGIGKSTLISLILGIYTPESGSITINGEVPCSALSQKCYSLGYVGPEPFLFQGTLKENLLYGNRQAPADLTLIATLHLLGLFQHDSAPLQQTIEDGGTNFSTGQRQRICIARALLNKPQFLVLDEVSANLDTETEAALAETLLELKGTCTVLIVTHRQGIIRYSDKVVKLG